LFLLVIGEAVPLAIPIDASEDDDGARAANASNEEDAPKADVNELEEGAAGDDDGCCAENILGGCCCCRTLVKTSLRTLGRSSSNEFSPSEKERPPTDNQCAALKLDMETSLAVE
jgi:hypothetical protein